MGTIFPQQDTLPARQFSLRVEKAENGWIVFVRGGSDLLPGTVPVQWVAKGVEDLHQMMLNLTRDEVHKITKPIFTGTDKEAST